VVPSNLAGLQPSPPHSPTLDFRLWTYLDHNTTTPVLPEFGRAILHSPFSFHPSSFYDEWGNPSSVAMVIRQAVFHRLSQSMTQGRRQSRITPGETIAQRLRRAHIRIERRRITGGHTLEPFGGVADHES
jgi:hypothetical protein